MPLGQLRPYRAVCAATCPTDALQVLGQADHGEVVCAYAVIELSSREEGVRRFWVALAWKLDVPVSSLQYSVMMVVSVSGAAWLRRIS